MRTVDHDADATGEQDRFEALPARVREALGELAGAAKEGLLALSVGVGLRRAGSGDRQWRPRRGRAPQRGPARFRRRRRG
jgi:hypothetical protein